MAGYSQKPLVKKLGIKSGQSVALVNAPKTFAKKLQPLPDNVRLTAGQLAEQLDFIMLFVDSAKTRFGQD